MDIQFFGNVDILRGIPGAGKSLWVKTLAKGDVFSTDNFFMEGGEYRFDPSRISEAHDWNLRRFVCTLVAHRDRLVAAAAEGEISGRIIELAENHLAIVDNTNLTVAEIAPYYQTAQALGFKVRVVTLDCPWEVAAARGTHGVPKKVVYRMSKTLDAETLRFPPWWNHDVYYYLPQDH